MSELDKLSDLLLQAIQKQAGMQARIDALQSVLTATLITLSQANRAGGQQIENIALRFSEGIADKRPEEYGDQVRKQTHTILATVRASLD